MSRSRRITALLTLALLALAFGVSATAAGSPVVETNASVTVSGRVFFDLDMHGDFDSGEPPVDGARVELRNSAGITRTLTTTDDLPDPGAFTFTDVPPGNYTVVVSHDASVFYTTPNSVSVEVGEGGDVTGVNFGLVLTWTVSGLVYEDVDGNDRYNMYTPDGRPADRLLADATVIIIDDRNGNVRMDAGEPILNRVNSDTGGFYIVPGIVPGNRIMAVQPAGLGAVWSDPVTLTLQAVGLESTANDIYVPYVASAAADLTNLVGTVWNDIDGDEIGEAGEPGVAGVRLELYVVGEQPQEATLLTSATTNATGHYQVNGVYAAWSYEIRPVTTTLPAGWIMSSTDPTLLFVPPSATGSTNTVNIGYYDPLSIAPMRQGDWKKELKQAGKPRYTPAQIDGFITKVEAESGVFTETVGIRTVLLQSPVQGDQGQALKEYAALLLNLASSRLYAATPINLPELTTATTVGAAVTEIEGVLAPGQTPAKDEYQRVRKLAEAINAGKGLGYGKAGGFGPAQATYRGASVHSKLQPAGDLVDLGMDAPAYLLKWSPGALNTAINVSEAKVRIKVKVFMDGGVLDVTQVLPDGRTELLGTIVPPVWNKDVNATYTLDLRGMSTAKELTSTEIRLVVRDISADGKPARVRIDSAEVVFKY